MNETAPSVPDRHFGHSTTSESPVDRDELRAEVQLKYAAVATAPDDDYHFHTGRFAAERCRYDMETVDALPEIAIESFAGVANPCELRSLQRGERVVDLGSGAGFDSFLAGRAVGPEGHIIGVDMTAEMLPRPARRPPSSGPTTSSSVMATWRSSRSTMIGPMS